VPVASFGDQLWRFGVVNSWLGKVGMGRWLKSFSEVSNSFGAKGRAWTYPAQTSSEEREFSAIPTLTPILKDPISDYAIDVGKPKID